MQWIVSYRIDDAFTTTTLQQNECVRTFLAGAAFLADCLDGVLAMVDVVDGF
jgi:hypothetical protein